jgi:hypothetical protein
MCVCRAVWRKKSSREQGTVSKLVKVVGGGGGGGEGKIKYRKKGQKQ